MISKTEEMKYRKVQGYQVVDNWHYPTNIATDRIIDERYLRLDNGVLTIKAGFCFEPSGPTIPTRSVMRGACAHDAFYWFMRNGRIEPDWKNPTDRLMREIHLLDRVNSVRAWYWYKAMNFSDFAIDPSKRMRVLTAP